MNECRYRAHISAVFNYSSLYLLGTVGLKLRSTLVFLESLRVTCLSCLRHDKQGILLGTNPTLVSFAVTHHSSFNEKWLEQSPEEFQLILKQIINFRNMSLKKGKFWYKEETAGNRIHCFNMIWLMIYFVSFGSNLLSSYLYNESVSTSFYVISEIIFYENS